MKRLFMRKRNKKGFTLMEVVIALAVVGLMCSLVLPLTASAMNSFNAAQKMREVASGASKKMANTEYGKTGKGKETLYVTIEYSSLKVKTESMLKFSTTNDTNSQYEMKITYYDLEQKNVKGTADT